MNALPIRTLIQGLNVDELFHFVEGFERTLVTWIDTFDSPLFSM